MNRKQRRAEQRHQGKSATGGADRLLQQAADQRTAGRLRDAVTIYKEILSADPDHPIALHQFGVTAIMAGQGDLAVDLIERAITAAGDDGASFRPDLAYALAMVGYHGEALEIYESLLTAQPNDGETRVNFANLLYVLQRADEAEAEYRKAIALSPAHVEAYANLGTLLHEGQRYEEAIETFQAALALQPESADLHHNLGAVYRALDRFDEAAASYAEAVRRAPNRPDLHEKHGAALSASGDLDEAAAAFRRALAQTPDFVDARTGLAEVAMAQGAPKSAIDLCDEYLRDFGYNSGVIAAKALAHNDASEAAEAAYFLDLDRFVCPAEIGVPPTFTNRRAFDAAIEAEARAHPSLTFEPPAVATTSGFQTGDLFHDAATPAIAALRGAVNAAVRDYIAALPDEPSHPFIANAPDRWTLNGWTVILKSQGHQRAHIHPDGWLSGVYYVKVPDSVSDTPGGSEDGWIEFGRPPDNVRAKRENPTRRIAPREGVMILFPSYLYHRTIPFEDSGERISFAFDVIAQHGVDPAELVGR